MKVVLEHLTKVYPSRDKKGGADVLAVGDFSFEIPDGKLIGLLGPSGCGKSTTLNLISGLETPTEGKVFFGAEDVTSLPPQQRGVGLVFQNYALYPHMTVEENIIFPLQNLKGEKKMTKRAMQDAALRAAKLVQIDTLMERKPGEMSGGQQQRVAIARALVKKPKVLLLDEPLSNLDARLRLQTREELRRIQRRSGVTTIFVTHDQEEAMSISDLIVVMKAGVVQQIGAPQDVYDQPANQFVAEFLGTPPINMLEGEIREGFVTINGEKILQCVGLRDQKVMVGIRPEGFIPDNDGPFTCDLHSVEVMGRDTSIVSTHKKMQGRNIRSIISAENRADIQGPKVHFRLRPSKVFLFDAENGNRLEGELK